MLIAVIKGLKEWKLKNGITSAKSKIEELPESTESLMNNINNNSIHPDMNLNNIDTSFVKFDEKESDLKSIKQNIFKSKNTAMKNEENIKVKENKKNRKNKKK